MQNTFINFLTAVVDPKGMTAPDTESGETGADSLEFAIVLDDVQIEPDPGVDNGETARSIPGSPVDTILELPTSPFGFTTHPEQTDLTGETNISETPALTTRSAIELITPTETIQKINHVSNTAQITKDSTPTDDRVTDISILAPVAQSGHNSASNRANTTFFKAKATFDVPASETPPLLPAETTLKADIAMPSSSKSQAAVAPLPQTAISTPITQNPARILPDASVITTETKLTPIMGTEQVPAQEVQPERRLSAPAIPRLQTTTAISIAATTPTTPVTPTTPTEPTIQDTNQPNETAIINRFPNDPKQQKLHEGNHAFSTQNPTAVNSVDRPTASIPQTPAVPVSTPRTIAKNPTPLESDAPRQSTAKTTAPSRETDPKSISAISPLTTPDVKPNIALAPPIESAPLAMSGKPDAAKPIQTESLRDKDVVVDAKETQPLDRILPPSRNRTAINTTENTERMAPIQTSAPNTMDQIGFGTESFANAASMPSALKPPEAPIFNLAPHAAPPKPELANHVAQQIFDAVKIQPDRPIEIALNPQELGRIKITLQMHDGAISVLVLADNTDTTDLMRRHIDTLSQKFADIGFENINFSFGKNSGGNAGSGANTPDRQTPELPQDAAPNIQVDPSQSPRQPQIKSGLDLRV